MEINYTRQATKGIDKILTSDARLAASLSKRISELQQTPVPPSAKPMKGFPEGTYRIPFGGDYGRIVYYVGDDDLKILAVGPRQQIYRNTDFRTFIKQKMQ